MKAPWSGAICMTAMSPELASVSAREPAQDVVLARAVLDQVARGAPA